MIEIIGTAESELSSNFKSYSSISLQPKYEPLKKIKNLIGSSVFYGTDNEMESLMTSGDVTFNSDHVSSRIN